MKIHITFRREKVRHCSWMYPPRFLILQTSFQRQWQQEVYCSHTCMNVFPMSVLQAARVDSQWANGWTPFPSLSSLSCADLWVPLPSCFQSRDDAATGPHQRCHLSFGLTATGSIRNKFLLSVNFPDSEAQNRPRHKLPMSYACLAIALNKWSKWWYIPPPGANHQYSANPEI